MDTLPISSIPAVPVSVPAPRRHGFVLSVLFVVFAVVGFAGAWYVVPRYVPEVGKFYASETITCADAGYNYPDDVCAEAVDAGGCEKRQQYQGQEFDGYCFLCDAGALEQYCGSNPGGGGPTGPTGGCDPSKIATSFNGGTVTFTNGSAAACDVHVTSWRIYDQNLPAFLDTQQQNDASTGSVNSGGSITLSVNVPSCSNQVDAGLGSPPSTAHYTSGNYIDGRITMTDFLCDGTCIGASCQPTTTTPPPTACTPRPACLNDSPPCAIRPAPGTEFCPSTLPNGSLDTADCTVVEGWARDADSPNTPVRVQIFQAPVDGAHLLADSSRGDFRTDIPRTDNPWPFPNRNYGFSWPIPASLKDGQPHTIYTFALDNEDQGHSTHLIGSPKTITCPAPPPINNPVVCSPKTQQIVVSGSPSGAISATGGNCPAGASCTYGWTADAGVVLSSTFGSSVTATYTNTTGVSVTKNITVHFGPDQSDTCSIVVPPTPTQTMTLSVTPGSLPCDDPQGTTLSWTAVAGADHYAVGRSATSGGPYTTLANVPNTTRTYTDSPPPTGTVYYVVSAWMVGTASNVTSNQVSTNITATTCPGPSHMACVNNACTVVATAGANTCSTSADCVTTNLVCTPASQQGTIGQYGTVQASGGSGTYTWNAPGAAYLSQVGTNSTFRYDQSGNFTIMVTDGQGRTATCAVIIPVISTLTPTPPPTTPALLLQKVVRNVTRSTGEAESVNAVPTDTVEFSLRVSSVGVGAAMDVVVRDALPAGLTYQSGTTTIDSIPTADGIMTTGVNLGSLASGRTVIIRFRATVSPEAFFNIGTTVLTNIGSVVATNIGQLTDPAQVLVTRGTSVTQVPTGPGESAALALIVSGIITLLYVGYTSTDSFRAHEAGDLAHRARGDKDLFNFKK